MATVTNNMTRIHDAEGSLTTGNIPAGGAGASANTDIVLQGSQTLGRRQTTTGASAAGFALVDAADNDCSATGVHVGMWIWITHFAILQTLQVSLGTGTTPASNYAFWTLTPSKYPAEGGWVRIWVDTSAPSGTGAGTYTRSQTRHYGVQCSFTGTPGGNAANLILDSSDFVAGAALTLTGTSGVWSDFYTSDSNTTNQYGVFRRVAGVNNQWARVQLGTSGTSLVFSDSNFVIIFTDQEHVSTTFMGIDVDLQNASTDIDWLNGVIRSAGTRRGDLVVTGTSGDFDASGMTLAALRVVTLTSVCSLTSSSFVGCGQITGAGAVITNNVYSGYEGAADTSYLLWDVDVNPDGKFNNSTFIKGTAATHAVEFGTSSPVTMTLRGIAFSGYNSSNNENDSTLYFGRTSDTVTVNLVGCSGNISYKSAGATIAFVVDPVTTAINVKNANTGANVQNARVLLQASDGTGPMPYQKTTTISRSGSVATASCTGHGLLTNDYAVIKGADQPEYNGVFQVTRIDDDSFSYTVSGTPATPATGTITTTGAPLYGLTDVDGNLSTSRSFATSQPIIGRVRKASAADDPKYKTGVIAGTISSTTGFSTTVQLIPDQ